MALEMGEYPVPEKHRGKMPDDISELAAKHNPAAWETAVWWLDNSRSWVKGGTDPGHGLVLVGPIGSGKTTVAAAWINFIGQVGGYRTGFLSDATLARLLRYRYRDEDADAALLNLENSGYLVVDDLARMGSQHVIQDVEAFLRVREDGGHPTIVTLNNGMMLSESLSSFLSTWTWALFDGPDLRDPGKP